MDFTIIGGTFYIDICHTCSILSKLYLFIIF